MLTKLAGGTMRLTGWLLGGVAAGAPLWSIFVCVVAILAGPGTVLNVLVQ